MLKIIVISKIKFRMFHTSQFISADNNTTVGNQLIEHNNVILPTVPSTELVNPTLPNTDPVFPTVPSNDPIISTNFNNNNLNNSDITELIQDVDMLNNDIISQSLKHRNITSTFDEAFPNYQNSEDSGLLVLSNILSDYLQKDPNELLSILKKEGLTEGLKLIKNTHSDALPHNLNINNADDLKIQLDNIDSKINNLENKDSLITGAIEPIESLHTKIDNLGSVTNKFVEFMLNHQASLDIMFQAGAMVSPILAYRKLLTSYSKFLNVDIQPKGMNIEQWAKVSKMRQLHFKQFNKVMLPILGVIYVSLWEAKRFNTSNKPQLIIQDNTYLMSFFNIIKAPNWLLPFIAPILIFVVIRFIPDIILYISPSFYNFIINYVNENTITLLYIGFIWLLGWVLFFIIEFYLFLVYSIKKNLIVKSNYLPRIINNWLLRIEESTSLNLTNEIIKLYLKKIFFFLIIIIVYICIIYIFF
jgi:hypothetical protein